MGSGFFMERRNLKIKNILILGLGGGSAAKLLTNIFPQAEIVGVDIDPVMVKAGQKYLGLGEIDQLKTIICDARSYIKKNNHLHDLIIVDLYQGYQVPDFVGSLKFLTDLKHKLTRNGMVIFNRLYFQKYISEADQFLDKLREIYHDVVVIKVRSNIFIQV